MTCGELVAICNTRRRENCESDWSWWMALSIDIQGNCPVCSNFTRWLNLSPAAVYRLFTLTSEYLSYGVWLLTSASSRLCVHLMSVSTLASVAWWLAAAWPRSPGLVLTQRGSSCCHDVTQHVTLWVCVMSGYYPLSPQNVVCVDMGSWDSSGGEGGWWHPPPWHWPLARLESAERIGLHGPSSAAPSWH